MTKLIAITQREIRDQASDESRDSIDRRWFSFFQKCDLVPILLPNEVTLVKGILQQVKIDGILLTGGGDIKSCGGKDFKREEVEEFLIKLAVKKKIPLLGICRGMQKLQDSFGIALDKVSGHIADKHKIIINKKSQEVNSFHNFGTKKNDDKIFEVFALAEDGVIKGIRHKKLNIAAIMWHPERFAKPRLEDLKLFHEVFK